jgi:glycosyltransferase involved in cell wall biosynthesis
MEEKAKPNILIATTVPFPEGRAAAKRLMALAEGFIACGYRVLVISQNERGVLGCREDDSFKLVKVRPLKPRCGVNGRTAKKIRESLKTVTPDSNFAASIHHLLHSYSIEFVYLYSSVVIPIIPTLKTIKKFDIPIVLDRNEHYSSFSRRFRYLFPSYWHLRYSYFRLLREATMVVAITETLRQDSMNYNKHTLVVPAIKSFGGKSFRTREPLNPNRVAYFGLLRDRENPRLIVRFFKEFLEVNPNAKLELVGRFADNPEGFKNSRWIKDQFEAGTVVLVGSISDEELTNHFETVGFNLLFKSRDFSQRCCFPTRIPELLEFPGILVLNDHGETKNYLAETEGVYFIDERKDFDINKIYQGFGTWAGTDGWPRRFKETIRAFSSRTNCEKIIEHFKRAEKSTN